MVQSLQKELKEISVNYLGNFENGLMYYQYYFKKRILVYILQWGSQCIIKIKWEWNTKQLFSKRKNRSQNLKKEI